MRSLSVVSSCTALAALLLADPAVAQLSDLQPGRNFIQSAQFGTGRTENIDVGDVDNDGDLDVIVANGGDGSAQANRIYINNGGLQGGSVGTFSDGTGSRFSGIPNDTSRDIEFMDMDNDGDLDIYVSNRGTSANGGEPSRFYENQGGFQGGTIGFFQEDSNSRWGSLISVPSGDQVLGGNAGPFRDYTCDCDFGDTDDDGDLDLFHSSYGLNIAGNRDSRLFENDGSGVFDELWPWINSGGDIRTHTLDLDLVDFDGDWDLDIFMSSRDSQARVYANNLYNSGGSRPFQDITQTALINTGATLSGSDNYEAEPADIDGDGDFDIWAKNYASFADRILINNGPSGTGFTFTKKNNWIDGDPNADENEVDFIDFDGDGDLDAFVANFSGTNSLYYSGLAQGLNPDTQSMFHRAGTSGTLASSFPELPSAWNSGTTLDGETGDMDNDGDDDLLLGNDGNQQNRYFENDKGVPDSHAPTFQQVTVQLDKPTGSETVIHARVNDNTAFYIMAYYDADLRYRVNGGSYTTVDMFAQGGQQYRGVIPDSNGTVDYFVEVTDMGGNTGVSTTTTFVQGGGGPVTPWTDIGNGLAGISGIPSLVGTGTLVAGSAGTLTLSNARNNSATVMMTSFSSTPVPFKGGTLVTVPIGSTYIFTTNGSGTVPISWSSWPSGLPAGLDLYVHWAVDDAAAVQGVALSNALQATMP